MPLQTILPIRCPCRNMSMGYQVVSGFEYRISTPHVLRSQAFRSLGCISWMVVNSLIAPALGCSQLGEKAMGRERDGRFPVNETCSAIAKSGEKSYESKRV